MRKPRYSLWHPAPDWHNHDPFPGVESLVDPTVTTAQIRRAVEEEHESERSRAFRTEIRVEHLAMILD